MSLQHYMSLHEKHYSTNVTTALMSLQHYMSLHEKHYSTNDTTARASHPRGLLARRLPARHPRPPPLYVSGKAERAARASFKGGLMLKVTGHILTSRFTIDQLRCINFWVVDDRPTNRTRRTWRTVS